MTRIGVFRRGWSAVRRKYSGGCDSSRATSARRATPEFAQDFCRRPAVVLCLMRFLIQQVRGAQPFQAVLVIFEAPGEKLIEIEQVADIFLNRPLVAVAPRKQSRRHIPHSLFDPRRRAAQPLDDLRVQLDGKAEIEFALEPKRPGHDALLVYRRFRCVEEVCGFGNHSPRSFRRSLFDNLANDFLGPGLGGSARRDTLKFPCASLTTHPMPTSRKQTLMFCCHACHLHRTRPAMWRRSG